MWVQLNTKCIYFVINRECFVTLCYVNVPIRWVPIPHAVSLLENKVLNLSPHRPRNLHVRHHHRFSCHTPYPALHEYVINLRLDFSKVAVCFGRWSRWAAGMSQSSSANYLDGNWKMFLKQTSRKKMKGLTCKQVTTTALSCKSCETKLFGK